MTSVWEVAARHFEAPPAPKWLTPGALAQALDPPRMGRGTLQTPALEVIDEALTWAFSTPDARLIISMPPQEGKSQRASRWFPLWVLTQDPDKRIAIASYEAGVARRWGRAIRDDILTHHSALGLQVRSDLAAQSEWGLAKGEGGVYTAGVGGALTGRPVDVLIIDDPIKGRAEADSLTMRETVWEWYTDSARTRLAPGAPVILILTRWHEDDLAGRLLSQADGEEFRVVSIPAQCQNPETDPLERKAGEFMKSARGRTQAQWEALKRSQPSRTWAALYQQTPVPDGGAVWHIDWIDLMRKRTGDMPRLERTVVSVDPAAKSKKSSDLTGIVVAGIDALGRVWVLDDKTLRGTPAEWAEAVWRAVFEYNASEVVVEDNQGGEMVVSVLRSAYPRVAERLGQGQVAPRVTPVTATQSKRVRAERISAQYELGNVHHVTDGTARLDKLEQQMVTWTGDGDSPDRIDALVHGVTALLAPAKRTDRRVNSGLVRARGGYRR